MGAEPNAEQCGAQQTIYPINAGMQQTNVSEEEGNDGLILLDIIIWCISLYSPFKWKFKMLSDGSHADQMQSLAGGALILPHGREWTLPGPT